MKKSAPRAIPAVNKNVKIIIKKPSLWNILNEF
jgi:hypothetical protein